MWTHVDRSYYALAFEVQWILSIWRFMILDRFRCLQVIGTLLLLIRNDNFVAKMSLRSMIDK